MTDRPDGREYGNGRTGQIAHLGLFIPLPHYRSEYEAVLHETKVLTCAKEPVGYIGEDVLVEVEDVPAETQAPYSPRPVEPSRMSLNYGEYDTMENAETPISRASSSATPSWCPWSGSSSALSRCRPASTSSR